MTRSSYGFNYTLIIASVLTSNDHYMNNESHFVSVSNLIFCGDKQIEKNSHSSQMEEGFSRAVSC